MGCLFVASIFLRDAVIGVFSTTIVFLSSLIVEPLEISDILPSIPTLKFITSLSRIYPSGALISSNVYSFPPIRFQLELYRESFPLSSVVSPVISDFIVLANVPFNVNSAFPKTLFVSFSLFNRSI